MTHTRYSLQRRLVALGGAQRGVALIVALVLLAVATIIGVAGVRGINLQERMSANMYDRSLAFQRAESALRAAEAAITSNWKIADLGGKDCSAASGNKCTAIPTTTFTSDNTNWTTVTATYDVNAGRTPGDPQYNIQFLGTGPADSDLALSANADYANYGSPYPPDEVAYYRVTARSSNPGVVGERSVVVLQTTVKRKF